MAAALVKREIVLIGSVGCGKSTFGNALLGDENSFEAGVSEDGAGVTKAVLNVAGCWEDRDRLLHLSVTDTPGSGDHSLSEDDLKKYLARCLLEIVTRHKKSSLDDFGVNCFVLLCRADSAGRVTKGLLQELAAYQAVIGPDFWNHVIIVFSRCDFTDEHLQLPAPFCDMARTALPEYQAAEDNLVRVLHEKFGFSAPLKTFRFSSTTKLNTQPMRDFRTHLLEQTIYQPDAFKQIHLGFLHNGFSGAFKIATGLIGEAYQRMTQP